MSGNNTMTLETKSKKGRPEIKDDLFIELYERFDQNKLNHLLKNKETFISQMRVFDDDYNPFAIASKYLDISRNGMIKTKYKQNNSFGRFYAIGSLSLQSLPREIRHTIASEHYIDIDIKNCHPVILSFLCEKRDIKCKYLNKYNKKRDKFLVEICDNKDQAKKVVLSMINGGDKDFNKIKNPPIWLNKFKKELKNIHDIFAKDKAFEIHRNKRIENGKNYNHQASYMNILLCDFENNILQIIYKNLGSPKECVLCFDGIMILKDTTYDLLQLEKAVKNELDIEISLIVKEMSEGFEIGNVDIYIDESNNTFNFTNPYNYNDFHTEFNSKTFESYEDMEAAIVNYPKVIAHVLQGSGCFIKKLKDGNLDVVKHLDSSDFRMIFQKKYKVTLEEYLCSKLSYGQIACELENCPPDEFNLWTGFQAKRVSYPESDELKLMKSFIMENWANNNELQYNYIISWFAGLVTNLKGINRIALAMVSPQGTGKGTLIEFMDLVLRSVNIVSVAGIEKITGRFNTILQGKRLVNINEMSSTKDEFRSNFDKIKSYISDPTITIEPKGVNPYKVKNISNFVLFTNHRDAIVVEESDRRYAIFEMSVSHINDNKYFGNIRSKCFNQDVANEFYTYLLDFPAVDIGIIPHTELRQEMMNASKSTPLKFLDAVRENKMFDNATEVEAMAFYTAYKDWCSDNGERLVQTSTKFGTIIKTKLQKRHTRNGNIYIL